MAITSAHIGSGTIIAIDKTAGGAGTTFVAVAECTNAAINNSGEIVDVTAFDSSELGQFIIGSRGAILTFSGNFLPDSHNLTAGPLMLGLIQARTIFSFKVTHADAGTPSTATGSGFFTNFTMSCSGHDSVVEFSATIRVTPTDTYANGVTYSMSA